MYAFLKVFFLSVVIFISTFLQGQNIVPNGNLEDVNICTEFNAPCSPSAWFPVNSKPTGFYHRFAEKASSGKQYFELAVVNNGPFRQYWQTKLLCNMVPGKSYEVSVDISGREPGPNVFDIGFYFTNNFLAMQNDTLLTPAAFIGFADATVTRLKHNWFRLTKKLVASGSEQYLILGNFSAQDNRAILSNRHLRFLIMLLVDNISIIADKNERCLDYRRTKDSLYAIRKRHAGDTIHAGKTIVPETVVDIKKTVDTGAIVTTQKIDTLQLSNVLFEFDKYVLIHPDTIEAFRSVLLNPSVKKIQVVGYTDDAGSETYNKLLSEKRAQEIVRLIKERFQISSAVIQSEGRGVSRAYADKSLNRRVDIYVYY